MSVFDWCKSGSSITSHAKCKGYFQVSVPGRKRGTTEWLDEWYLCECESCKHKLPEGAHKKRKPRKRKIEDADLEGDEL